MGGQAGQIAVGSYDNFEALNPDGLILSSSNVNSFIGGISLTSDANVSLYGCGTGDTDGNGFNLAVTISGLTGGTTMGVNGELQCTYDESTGYQLYFPNGSTNYTE